MEIKEILQGRIDEIKEEYGSMEAYRGKQIAKQILKMIEVNLA